MDTLADPSIFTENKKIVELGIGIKDESSFGASFLRLWDCGFFHSKTDNFEPLYRYSLTN